MKYNAYAMIPRIMYVGYAGPEPGIKNRKNLKNR
jgi:hypothetical protein